MQAINYCCHIMSTNSLTVFMAFNIIINRNLLVGPDSFYHIYFLFETHFLFVYEGSSLPFLSLKGGCWDFEGGAQENLAPRFTCGFNIRRRERYFSPKGIYDRFPCRVGKDFIRWSISNIKKNQNEKTGNRRHSLCSEKSVIYLNVVELEWE